MVTNTGNTTITSAKITDEKLGIQNQEYTILKDGVEFEKSDDETCFVDYSDFSAG